MKLCILAASLLFAVMTIVIGMGDLNRAGVFWSEGEITEGSKFGIAIGDNLDSAQVTLESLSLDHGVSSNGQCNGRKTINAEVLSLWEDTSWRRGVICLISQKEKITRIGWRFGGWEF